jgi:mRNA interferase RelE/StbE
MATVLLHPDVEKKLQRLPNDIETRIRSKLEDAGENPDRHLKPLKGREEYSLRIGKRRAIIDWVKPQDELRVLEVDTRETVYE